MSKENFDNAARTAKGLFKTFTKKAEDYLADKLGENGVDVDKLNAELNLPPSSTTPPEQLTANGMTKSQLDAIERQEAAKKRLAELKQELADKKAQTENRYKNPQTPSTASASPMEKQVENASNQGGLEHLRDQLGLPEDMTVAEEKPKAAKKKPAAKKKDTEGKDKK